MAKQIQIRRDTAANWTAANPVLAQGEIGIELDGLGTSTVLQKIGDGVTAWNDLPYQESGGGGAVDSVNGQTGVVVLDKSDIGLGNVDNTSDADKPISNATQTALNDKASQNDLNALDGRVSDNESDIQTLQNNQVNPNNFVNKVTSATQDMTGRLTVQTPLDSNTSDAANVEYVSNKLGDYIEEATVASSTEKGGLFFDYDSVTNTLILKAQ